jgi:hypothetical protein
MARCRILGGFVISIELLDRRVAGDFNHDSSSDRNVPIITSIYNKIVYQ